MVRGSSERVSTSLIFDVFVNSTSIEDDPSDNQWNAEVQLIKEADLQVILSMARFYFLKLFLNNKISILNITKLNIFSNIKSNLKNF